jgi:hypothetical protein
VDDQLAPRDAVGLALLEVDVEVDLVGLAAAGEGEAGVAAEVALVEHEALESLDLVGLPLAAGGVVGGADRGALVGAQRPSGGRSAVGEGAGAGGDAELALDVAPRERDVAVDADAADALAGDDLDRQLARAVGEEGGAVAELLQLGADGLGVEVAGLEAEDAAQAQAAVAGAVLADDADVVDVGDEDAALFVLEGGAGDQLDLARPVGTSTNT